ncbi:MAG: hypothetical protein H6850_04575 [Alphaproteobacteria bacterium]|nr:MAG: hypothetical protein H6850_04575 [Alphaproteobacteria bacterium]
MKRLNLIDGYGYVFRAYYALPPLTNPKGDPVGAVFGFCRMMIKLMQSRPDELFLAVFDSGKTNFRHDLYPEYKSKRVEAPEDLKKQFPIIRDACKALGIHQVEQDGYEADDIIASYAKKASQGSYIVNIISGDKDFMQLLTNEKVKIFHPIKEKELTSEDVLKKFGVPPHQVLDVQSIMGDSSDGIPGIPGIGPKGAQELISKYKTLEGVYEHLDDLPNNKRKERLIEHKDKAFISKQLAHLKDDLEIKHDLSQLHLESPDRTFFQENGFHSLLAMLEQKAVKLKTLSSFEEFYKRALNSLEVYIRIDGNSTTCLVNGFAFETSDANFLKNIKPLLENPGITKIFHSVKDVIYQCQELDTNLKGYHALESMSLCLFSGKHDHSLKALEAYYNDKNLYPLLKKDLVKAEALSLYEQGERYLPEILVNIEKHGIQIDMEFLMQYEDHIEKELVKCEKEIYNIVGKEFNINSPKQLGAILFEDMQIIGTTKTKTGSYSTDSDVLEKINLPLTNLILTYRQLAKILNTYVKPLIEKTQKGRVHTTLLHNNVLTGRLSSQNPNLQNIPAKSDDVRKAFVAPKGTKLLSFDYSQIELRLLAHFSQEKALVEAFRHGEDIHAKTAQEVFGTVTDETRRNAKMINYGIIYGMSAFGLSEALKIPKSEAQKIIDQYVGQYKNVQAYIETQKAMAKTQGFVKTLFNKRIYISEIQGKFAGHAERQSINAPLQGTTADMMKIAMNRVYFWLQMDKLRSKMILQVHDELLFEVPKNEVDIVKMKVKFLMETVCDFLDVPIIANMKMGENWQELK